MVGGGDFSIRKEACTNSTKKIVCSLLICIILVFHQFDHHRYELHPKTLFRNSSQGNGSEYVGVGLTASFTTTKTSPVPHTNFSRTITGKEGESLPFPSTTKNQTNGDMTIRRCSQQENNLANHWCHPENYRPCYQSTTMNWTACAGDHLLYEPSTPQQLYKRQYMCLFEPLCWMQLDWRNTRPPTKFHCSIPHDELLFYDWAEHDGTMASLSSMLQQSMTQATNKTLRVVHCNSKRSEIAARNYRHDHFENCNPSDHPPFVTRWNEFPQDGEKEQLLEAYHNWARDSKAASHIHAHILSFFPQMFEFFQAMNQTLLIHLLHRPNIFRCSYKESKRNLETLIRLASSGPTGRYKDAPLHIIAPGYVHDVEYIRHYTNIRSLYLPYSLLNVLPKQPYAGTLNNTYLWNAHINVPNQLRQSNYKFVKPRAYELVDWLQYKAVIVSPYSITNTKSLEQYEMNIPLFVPTPEFALELGLFDDRTATYTPYCQTTKPSFSNDRHPPRHPNSPYMYSPNARQLWDGPTYHDDELFWISFSEVYLWPCITYFTSWPDLLNTLESMMNDDETYHDMSRCMEQANRWRKYEADTNTCWILRQLSSEKRRPVADHKYHQTLQSLYGMDHMFV